MQKKRKFSDEFKRGAVEQAAQPAHVQHADDGPTSNPIIQRFAE